ncbi:MAG: AMP-binding protein [Planctomycetes bacterium]|nr:AMP-binding protein [Planctomycetota bacterium]
MRTRFRFKTLVELFNRSLARIERPDKQCLEVIRTGRHELLTFRELRTRAQRFAFWLIRRPELAVGDKVAVLGRNRADWDVAFWGTVLAGAVPVLIDPERGVEGVINHLVHTEADLLVMADDYQDAESRRELRDFTSARGLGLLEMAETPFCNSLDDEKNSVAPEQIDELLAEIAGKLSADDTAVILCTSGTTGDPREVELTHTNLIANIDGSVEKIKITADDILGHILPPHHSFGLTVAKLLTLSVGAKNIYTNEYRQIPQLIADKSITIFVAIPALFTVLAKRIEETLAKQKKANRLIRVLDRYRPKMVGRGIVAKLGWGTLRFFFSGAAPMPKWVLNVFWKRGLLLYEGYGTTENSPVYGFNEDARTLGSVGRPIPTLEVKILSERNETLRPGENGEIMLGGPCIMKGYYKNPTATQDAVETDSDGVRWLHTGDLGHLDADGNLFITGRKKFLIVLPGGKNVNPELVESALLEARFVGEILVVPGVKTDSAGVHAETVRAIVQPAWDAIENHTNHSQADLLRQPHILKTLVWQSINECQKKSKRLSSFEKISSAGVDIQIQEFQKTSTGKIKRQAYIRL